MTLSRCPGTVTPCPWKSIFVVTDHLSAAVCTHPESPLPVGQTAIPQFHNSSSRSFQATRALYVLSSHRSLFLLFFTSVLSDLPLLLPSLPSHPKFTTWHARHLSINSSLPSMSIIDKHLSRRRREVEKCVLPPHNNESCKEAVWGDTKADGFCGGGAGFGHFGGCTSDVCILSEERGKAEVEGRSSLKWMWPLVLSSWKECCV